MRRPSCEEIRIAAMALAEGERADLSLDEIQEHLAACAGCRQEVAQMEALAALWARQARRPSAEDLWPGLAERLAATAPAPRVNRGPIPIWLLALLLGTYKLIEFVPDRSWPLAVQFVPVAVALAWFLWSKQNPFRVDVELRMEGGGES